MTAKTFSWQSNGGGDLLAEDLERTAAIDGASIRWATVTDEYDDDRPYTGASEKLQDVADFLANGPIEPAPLKILEAISAALSATPAWIEPLRLQYAAAEGNLTATRGLLRIGGAHKDTVVRGKTPLSAAIEAERIDTATCLLDGGCDPNVRLEGGETALHVAARHCKTAASAALLRELLTSGADIEARSASGQTPLVAGLCGHLCKEGVLTLVEDRKAINLPADDGTTPLLAEARGWCRPSVVRALIGAGADVNLRSKDGWSPLLWAITKHDLWLVKMLIDARADVNVVGQPHKHGQPARSALALALSFVGAAGPADASSSQAALQKKSIELATQIVDALKAAGAT